MGWTIRTAPVSSRSTVGAEVFHWGEEALLQAADLPQGAFPRRGRQFQDFAREGQQRQLDISVLMVNDHELIFEVELVLDEVRMPTGQLLLVEFPELPLPQGVTQKHEHHLRGDGIE